MKIEDIQLVGLIIAAGVTLSLLEKGWQWIIFPKPKPIPPTPPEGFEFAIGAAVLVELDRTYVHTGHWVVGYVMGYAGDKYVIKLDDNRGHTFLKTAVISAPNPDPAWKPKRIA